MILYNEMVYKVKKNEDKIVYIINASKHHQNVNTH